MHKKFEINGTKIKGGCQLRRKVVTHNSKSDLPLVEKSTVYPTGVTSLVIISLLEQSVTVPPNFTPILFFDN